MAKSTDAAAAPRVSRFDLELWARVARQAEEAARIEDAPTSAAIVSALASSLDQALAEPAGPTHHELLDRWDADYTASHEPMAASRIVRQFAAERRRRDAEAQS